MKKIADFFFNTTIYKMVCICAMILTPSVLLWTFPQLVSVVLLLWGATILVKDLFTNRNLSKQPGSLFLVLFCLGYVITLVLYAENDLISTLNVYFWAIVEFFLLFAIERQKAHTVDTLAQELYKINIAVSVVALLSGIASLVIFLTKTSVIMPDPEGLNNFWSLGIINGRNSGIFNNAIPCGNAMFVGCAAALYNLIMGKKTNPAGKLFYGLTFLVSLLTIMTTLTRTFVYGVYAFVFVAGFYGAYQQWMQKGKTAKAVLLGFVVAIAVTGACAGIAEIGKQAMVKAVENVPMNNIIMNMEGFSNPEATEPSPSGPDATAPDSTKPPLSQEEQEQLKDYLNHKFGLDGNVDLDREELDRLPNFLYPRDEIWKVALQVIPHSPVFGFTSGNRESTSVAFGTTQYRITKWPTGIPTYHNAYFDIAVSAGLLGLVLMLAFLALQIIRTLRTLFTRRLAVSQAQTRWAIGSAVGYLATHVLVSCMFLGVLCFNNVSVCIYFWVLLGYVSGINDIALGDRNKPDFLERLLNTMKRK